MAAGTGDAGPGSRCGDGGGDRTAAAGESVGDAGESGACDGTADVDDLHVMALARQLEGNQRHADAARSLRLNHRTGAASVGAGLRHPRRWCATGLVNSG